MAEYIEREEVLNILASKNAPWNGYQKVSELPAADVQPVRWIPVTERLPNGNGEYLVSGKDKVWVCEFMILGSVGGWCNSAMNPCVKYWMPLPEPPKNGET